MSSTLIVQLDMERFCEEAGIPATYVIEIVEHGIIEPQGRTPDVWRFDDYELAIAQRATKLHNDLEMEWEGVALALDLIEGSAAIARREPAPQAAIGTLCRRPVAATVL